MLKELTRLAYGMLSLHGYVMDPAAASTRTCDEAPAAQRPPHERRSFLHHWNGHPGDRHLVEWLLLAVIWSGTLLLLSQTAFGLAQLA